MDKLASKLAKRQISYQLISKNRLNLIFHNILCVNYQNNTQKYTITVQLDKNPKKNIISYRVITINLVNVTYTYKSIVSLIKWYEKYLIDKEKEYSSRYLNDESYSDEINSHNSDWENE